MNTVEQEAADLTAVLKMISAAIANVVANGKRPPNCYFDVADEALGRLKRLRGYEPNSLSGQTEA